MYDLAQKNMTHQQVVDLLKLAHRRDGIEYRVDVVRGGIAIFRARYDECSLKCEGDRDVKHTGQFRIADDPRINWETDYLRPVMSFNGCEVHMVALKPITDPKTIGEGEKWHHVEAYDRSVQIQGNSVGEILFLEQGTLYTAAISGILERFGFPVHNIEPSPLMLTSDREDWAENDYILDICNQLLGEINYQTLAMDRDGILYARRYREPSIQNASIHYDVKDGILHPTKNITTDSYKRPNRFIGRAFNPDMETPLRFEHTVTDPSIPISTIRQGYTLTEVIDYNHIADADTLEATVLRHAFESGLSYESIEQPTAIMPHHDIWDVVTINAEGVSGIFLETGWEIDKWGKGGQMTHYLRRLICN